MTALGDVVMFVSSFPGRCKTVPEFPEKLPIQPFASPTGRGTHTRLPALVLLKAALRYVIFAVGQFPGRRHAAPESPEKDPRARARFFHLAPPKTALT